MDESLLTFSDQFELDRMSRVINDLDTIKDAKEIAVYMLRSWFQTRASARDLAFRSLLKEPVPIVVPTDVGSPSDWDYAL